MSSHLNYIRAQEHIADLTRAAEQARLAQEARKIENGFEPGSIAAVIERLRRSKARRASVRPGPRAAADVRPAPGTAADVS